MRRLRIMAMAIFAALIGSGAASAVEPPARDGKALEEARLQERMAAVRPMIETPVRQKRSRRGWRLVQWYNWNNWDNWPNWYNQWDNEWLNY